MKNTNLPVALSLLGVVLFVLCSGAQAQISFARLTDTGTWDDNVSALGSANATWVIDAGVPLDLNPGASDNVYLGNRTLPGGLGSGSQADTVTLSVGTFNQAANALFLGGIASNPSDRGVLNVDQGGGLTVGTDVTLSNNSEFVISNGGTAGVSVSGDILLNQGLVQLFANEELSASFLSIGTATESGIADLDGIASFSDLSLTNGSLFVRDDANVTVSDTMTVTLGAMLNRELGGVLTVENLIFSGGERVGDTLTVDDEINNLALTNSAGLVFTQSSGQMNGIKLGSLDIELGSMFEVNFDPETFINTDDADWILQLAGDQQDHLKDLLDTNRIFTTQFSHASDLAGPLKLGVFYDGSDTYLTAIPEPSSLTVLVLFGLVGLRRSRRQQAG